MFFKLVMPYIDRLAQGGIILKWHKAEGQRIGYGDDLFDMKVEVKLRRPQKPLSEKIKLLKEGKPLREEDLGFAEEAAPSLVYIARITSSDSGVLRRISAPEGSYANVGSLVALVSTEEHEPIEPLDPSLSRTSEFRVVPNLLSAP